MKKNLSIIKIFFPEKHQKLVSLEYQKRVTYTLSANIVLILFFFTAGLSHLLNGNDPLFFNLLMTTNIFVLTSFILIRLKKYEIASVVTVFWTIINSNLVNFLYPTEDYMALYRSIMYISGCGIAGCLIIYKEKHFFYYFPFLVLTYVAHLMIKVRPLYGELPHDVRSTVIAGFIVLFALLFLFYYIIKFSRFLIDTSERNAAKSQLQVKNLNKLFKSIKDNIKVLDTVKDESRKNSLALSNNSNMSATSVEEISATMEELTVSINNIAQNAKETYNDMANTVENAEKGMKYMKQSSEAIDKLVSMTGKISEFASEIEEFTEHTTLLALNASIEAARAKEYGKGFSVLAKEIQKLAAKSASSAQYIGGIVRDANNSIIDTYNKNNETVEIFGNINKKLGVLSKTFYEISEASQEDSQGAQDVVSSLDDISQVSENIVEVSDKIQDSVRKLDTITDKLSSLSNKDK